MRQVLLIALNDLKTTLRERGTWVNIFVVPVFMTILIGLVTRGSGSVGTLDIVRLDPKDATADHLVTILQAEAHGTFAICDFSAAQCEPPSASDQWRAFSEKRVQEGKASASLILPAGFGAALASGQNIQLDYVVKDALTTPTGIQQALDAALTQINGSYAAARTVVSAVKPASDTEQLRSRVLASAEALWSSQPVQIVEQASVAGAASSGTGFGQSAPGFGGMFVLINAVGLAAVFVVERQTWTMQRLLMMPIAPWQILAGKLLARYALGLIIFTTLIGVGALLGTQFGDWLGVVLVVLTYTLAATALALAFSTLVRTKSQAANIGILVGLTLAPLGGAWWPLSITPGWMQVIGHISPIAWSQDAFNRLIFYGGTAVDILPFVAVLLLYAAGLFAVGLRRFRYL
jgi:ABC-2 type transport system permease protein